MKRGSTFFLRGAVLALGAVVLAICLFALPAMLAAIGREYPHYAYAPYAVVIAMYIAVVPFFAALRQTLKLLHFIDKNTAFSVQSVNALKTIKYCAVTVSTVFAASMPFFFVWGDRDDAPGLIVIGMILTAAPVVVAVFAAVLQRLLRQAIDIKKENDLTV